MKQIFAILSGLTLIYIMTVVFANSVMDDLADNIIRFHVVANSNSESDQKIKLKIRDEILKSDIKIEDRTSAFSALRKMEEISNKVLQKEGFSYGARANLGYFKFPEKKYGRITLPKGSYNAVRIVLGKGLGENWWCILSPPACVIDKTVKFDEDALKSQLSPKTYAVISQDFKFKSKLLEILKKF